MNLEEYKSVCAYADDVNNPLRKKRDDTDLELAVLATMAKFQDATDILILGGLGGRFDHEIQDILFGFAN